MQKILFSIGVVLWATVIVYLFIPGTPLNVLAKGMTSLTIGNVDVAGLEADEMKVKLEEAIQQWLQEDVVVQGDGIELTIPAHLIEFDVDQSINLYETATGGAWYAFWEKKKIAQTPLQVTVSPLVTERLQAVPIWNTEAIVGEIVTQASYLNEKIIQVEAENAALFEQERLAFKLEKIPSGLAGVAEVAQLLNDRYFIVNEEISIRALYGAQAVGPNKDAVNFVASVLYATILQQNYEILERYRQQTEPNYLSPGLDVAIVDPIYDLKFANRTDALHKVKASVQNNELKIELYSANQGNKIEVDVETKQVQPRTIMRYTKDLAVGKRQVLQASEEGKRVEVYRRYYDEQGKLVEQLVSQDYYPPTHKIVLTSSRSEVAESKETGADGTETITSLEEELNPVQNTGTGNSSSDSKDEEQAIYDKGGNLIAD